MKDDKEVSVISDTENEENKEGKVIEKPSSIFQLIEPNFVNMKTDSDDEFYTRESTKEELIGNIKLGNNTSNILTPEGKFLIYLENKKLNRLEKLLNKDTNLIIDIISLGNEQLGNSLRKNPFYITSMLKDNYEKMITKYSLSSEKQYLFNSVLFY